MAGDNAESIRRLNPPELGTPPGYSQILDVRASRIIFIAARPLLIATARWSAKTIFQHRLSKSSET